MSRIENDSGQGNENKLGLEQQFRITAKTVDVLQNFEERLHNSGYKGTVFDWMQDQSANNISVKQVSRIVDLSGSTITKIYRQLGITILPQPEASRRSLIKLRQEPEFREKLAEISKERLKTARYKPEFKEAQMKGLREAMKRPETKRRMLEAAQKRAEVVKEYWQDPQWRAKMIESLVESWKDPTRRARQAERSRLMWQDPRMREIVFTLKARTKAREDSLRRWQDPEKRQEMIEKVTEGVRRSRASPEAIARFHLPTIQGFRGDVGFDAQSAWEANFARILSYCNREFYTRENFLLSVPDQYRTLFNTDQTQLTADFIVSDPRGGLDVYELMAHPTENPIGWAKINMLRDQFPLIRVHVITEKLYYRLQKCFRKKIDSHPKLFGWETSKDNLYTNPDKFLGKH